MIFRQVVHDDLGCASYLIGDEHAGGAAVVDPKLDVDEYLELARYMGVRIEHVLETHDHADHVSGHGRLAEATGATIHAHRLAAPGYEHEPFDDGWELVLGDVHVQALHTPGHRPEHTSFVLTDAARGPEPWAVLTGDTLFVGDVARADHAVDEEEGARALYGSLHDKLLTLPVFCEVWPAHLGGSPCGGPGMNMKVASTIAYELAHNGLLAEADEEAFVARAISAPAPHPPNAQAIVAANRGPLRGSRALALEPLTARQVEERRRAGALVVDVRADVQFDDAHIPGALCNPAGRAGFGTKLGWVVEPGADVIFVGRDDDEARRAARLAEAVGITALGGYLAGGMTSWREDRRATEPVERLDIAELHARRDAVQVLDVRERSEWEAGHLHGAVHVPYHDLHGIPAGVDPAHPIAVVCTSGERAAIAGSLLQRHGAGQVLHVAGGGVGTWACEGWPIERTAAATARGPAVATDP